MKCRTRTTALTKALGIEYISSTIKRSSLDLLKVCLLNNSMMQKFYCMLMNEPTVRQVASKTLYGRVSSYCRDKGINLLRYVFSDIYSCEITHKFKNEHIVKLGTNGLIDSIRGLLTNYDIISQFQLNNLFIFYFKIMNHLNVFLWIVI